MKIRIVSFLFIGFFLFPQAVSADTPLTSIDISKAYQDEQIVIKASKTEGILTVELIKYLLDPDKPIDIKIALINELGWNIDGKNNASIFFKYLKAYKRLSKSRGFFKKW